MLLHTKRQYCWSQHPASRAAELNEPVPVQDVAHPLQIDQTTAQHGFKGYNQERGMPSVTPPIGVMRENRIRTSRPDASLQEVASEAIERWLDDGGTSDHEAVYNG